MKKPVRNSVKKKLNINIGDFLGSAVLDMAITFIVGIAKDNAKIKQYYGSLKKIHSAVGKIIEKVESQK